MNIDKCVLTGFEIKEHIVDNSSPLKLKYICDYSGLVEITQPTLLTLSNSTELNWILAGINLHNTLNNQEQITIDSDFINTGYKNYQIPKEFDEKCFLTLRGLYQILGKENKTLDQGIGKYSALGYTNYDEFTRILDRLISLGLVDCRDKKRFSGNRYLYLGISISNRGCEKAKEMLPNIPMIKLVNDSIITGNKEIDQKIHFAKDMFFKQPQSMENMRSACEQLSYILEPLREKSKKYFKTKDVSDFFQIVNNFDIRHNKESTKNIKYEEQLEWIFYTLLNSISTYYKLDNRLKSSS